MMATTTRAQGRKKIASKGNMHYTEPYLIDPPHPVTIDVIGCGGTGSQVLNSLARMDSALRALGHPGLFVRAIDPDKVSEANLGRQLFSPSDLNEYKCMVLIGRVNRFFGNEWEGIPLLYNKNSGILPANITISCVDTGRARKEIRAAILNCADGKKPTENQYGYRDRLEPFQVPYYWIDFGNMIDRGQMVIGTVREIKQPKESEFNCLAHLPMVDKLHPEIMIDKKGDDQGPSCSLAEALGRQDLFINTNLANMGLGLLWKMFRELRIRYHGLYLNLENMSTNPIKIS